jgi:hypothetical protein
MRRTPIKSLSNERRSENRVRAVMMLEKSGPREEWRCLMLNEGMKQIVNLVGANVGRCFGGVHGHELKKRSGGGSITDPENIVLLCNFHNGYVEDHPSMALQLGLVIR